VAAMPWFSVKVERDEISKLGRKIKLILWMGV
jgi:hypothetical protein